MIQQSDSITTKHHKAKIPESLQTEGCKMYQQGEVCLKKKRKDERKGGIKRERLQLHTEEWIDRYRQVQGWSDGQDRLWLDEQVVMSLYSHVILSSE